MIRVSVSGRTKIVFPGTKTWITPPAPPANHTNGMPDAAGIGSGRLGRSNLAPWIEYYNTHRRPSSLAGLPPVSRLSPT